MSHQDIIDFVHNDNRSKEEIFESLKGKIQAKYNHQLTDKEAIAATQRFLGFFQTISDIYDDKHQNKLDDGDEND